MKIIELVAENVKKIKAVNIVPKGSLVQITGDNGEGKSSVLDSIYMALGGKDAVPGQPIRKGEKSARIKLDLGEIIVTRKFTEGGTTLTVEAASGARYPSPQRMLDDLMGSLSFDPLAFSRMDGKAQLEQVRKMVKLDIDIDALDGLNKTDAEKRTDVNRQIKELEGSIAGLRFAEGTPEAEIDTSALVQELEQAGEFNSEIERRKARRDAAVSNIEGYRNDAARINGHALELRRQAQELIVQAEAAEQNATIAHTAGNELQAKLDAAEALPEPKVTAEIRTKISEAETINKQVAIRTRRTELEAQLADKRSASDALTATIDERKNLRAKTIQAAKMPVPGLSFGDGQILLNELPFDQASSAEQLRVSVAIAMANNPKLRVLRIKDGGLLSEKGMALLAEMADSNDYQVFIEKVDTSGKIGIFMEDGSVSAVDGVPSKKPE